MQISAFQGTLADRKTALPVGGEIIRGMTMDRRTKICIWTIMLGMGNFLAYVLIYTYIWGEAVNGRVVSDSTGQLSYYLQSGRQVSQAAFIYSGVHSISIWPTVAAIMLAMLSLAKERIVFSMRQSILHGRTFISVFAVVIVLTTTILTIHFTREFVDHFEPVGCGGIPAATSPVQDNNDKP